MVLPEKLMEKYISTMNFYSCTVSGFEHRTRSNIRKFYRGGVIHTYAGMELRLKMYLKAYARRKDKNLRALMQYAGMFKVEKILRQYLEVLL